MKIGKFELILQHRPIQDNHHSPPSKELITQAEPPPKPEEVLRGESILLEEFHRATIGAYQVTDDMTATLNIYLIVVGFLATGLPALIGVILSSNSFIWKDNLTGLTFLILVIATFTNFCFFDKFIQLMKERLTLTNTMNTIKQFYVKQLEEPFPDLKEAFYEELQIQTELTKKPFYVFFLVPTLGSLYLSGAFFSMSIDYLSLYLHIVINNDVINYCLYFSTAIFLIAFFAHRYYYNRNSKIKTNQ